jgi:hypothetical protein
VPLTSLEADNAAAVLGMLLDTSTAEADPATILYIHRTSMLLGVRHRPLPVLLPTQLPHDTARDVPFSAPFVLIPSCPPQQSFFCAIPGAVWGWPLCFHTSCISSLFALLSMHSNRAHHLQVRIPSCMAQLSQPRMNPRLEYAVSRYTAYA